MPQFILFLIVIVALVMVYWFFQDLIKAKHLDRLKTYKENVSTFDTKYQESRKPELEAIDWLIAHYEGKAPATPKELYLSYMERVHWLIYRNYSTEEIAPYFRKMVFLYHWHHSKKFTGF